MAKYFEGIGRRKRSTCRVRIMKGSGDFIVNEKPLEEYFTRLGDADIILAPMQAVDYSRANYDVSVLVKGGGVTGQTSAVSLGLARAILKMDPELRSTLSRGGYLSRDARSKERKKPGLKGARKAPTYTKR
ncbi:MAG: 30S ribosomal protein S9 [Chloroflexota bacterium]|nr:MAG: 30S ribosomal protein S9 [Chloroflexota bacterium]